MTEFAKKLYDILVVGGRNVDYVSLKKLSVAGHISADALATLPFSVKVLLESVARQIDDRTVTTEHLRHVVDFRNNPGNDVAFKPARVIMQDFTGVPGIVDLAAMRDSLSDLGGDPRQINPLIPVDLVIDHSVQVDQFGSAAALDFNAKKEFERNRERYEFLHWASNSFDNFRVVPPATGIVHQVNLEYLAQVIQTSDNDGELLAYPDTLVGTDSHTTMINGIGVLGWGVGGIEAEAALLGQPLYIQMPDVIGVRLFGDIVKGVTATDLVLRVTEMLRSQGVVGKFVEFYGEGLGKLSLPDRATISNMCPEYGATAAFFPVDEVTLSYMRTTGRDESQIELVEAYAKAQGLFRLSDGAEIEFTETVELDLSTVEPSVAGPKRPQDRQSLSEAKGQFGEFVSTYRDGGNSKSGTFDRDGETHTIEDGAIVIAAITSCTNTSNPSVLVAAGLLAKKAVERGLRVPAHVKTSLAPGSRVVTRYLDDADLSKYLDNLGFNLVGYGCTTCIGNSGPLPSDVSKTVTENDLVAVSVLSGNRNFEGRIHPEIRANYLASPPLVVAYALAGRFDIDLTKEPLGKGSDGADVFLSDIWPDGEDIDRIVKESVNPGLFSDEYGSTFVANEAWNAVDSTEGDMYGWDAASTYIKRPPFFEGLSPEPVPPTTIAGARVLAYLGDSVTTDHISPAGIIAPDGPAAHWLNEQGIEKADFNSFGSRRGNHEVMMRGTFANIRIKNKLVPGVEGGYSRHIPETKAISIFDAAVAYRSEGTPLIVLAGKDYGMGSSRDWAAKGVMLLGVRATIAESYERIHRSNLIGMGVLPLQFTEGESAESLGLTGEELFDIEPANAAGAQVQVTTRSPDGSSITFTCKARIDTEVDLDYFRNGGILHTVLRQMAKQ